MRAESGGLLYSDIPPPPAFILLWFFFSRAAPERSGLLEQEQLELEHSGGGVRLIGRGVTRWIDLRRTARERNGRGRQAAASGLQTPIDKQKPTETCLHKAHILVTEPSVRLCFLIVNGPSLLGLPYKPSQDLACGDP